MGQKVIKLKCLTQKIVNHLQIELTKSSTFDGKSWNKNGKRPSSEYCKIIFGLDFGPI